MLSRARHRLHLFLRLAPITGFPRLAPISRFPAITNCIFSRAWHRLHVFPRLAGTNYMFSHAWHRWHVFPRLTGTNYSFSRAWHQLHVFPRLAPITRLPALGTDYTLVACCRFQFVSFRYFASTKFGFHGLHVHLRQQPHLLWTIQKNPWTWNSKESFMNPSESYSKIELHKEKQVLNL